MTGQRTQDRRSRATEQTRKACCSCAQRPCDVNPDLIKIEGAGWRGNRPPRLHEVELALRDRSTDIVADVTLNADDSAQEHRRLLSHPVRPVDVYVAGGTEHATEKHRRLVIQVE